MYLAKKNPLVDDRGGEASVLIELREYTTALHNLIKFLTGRNSANFHANMIGQSCLERKATTF